jgi:hypothetical protein
MNIARFSSRRALLAIGLALVAPVAALAQDATVTYDPATITISGGKGKSAEYSVNDVSVYASTSPAYDDVPASTSMSLSLTGITPIDQALLEWSSQAEGMAGETRDLVIVSKTTAEDGTETESRYEVTGAHVTSVSASFSTYAPNSISLSVEADKLTIDGVAMN